MILRTDSYQSGHHGLTEDSPVGGNMDWLPVVVGVDGSPESVQAAELGCSIAARAGVACRLVHAVPDYWTAMTPPDVPVDRETLVQAAEGHARSVIEQSLLGSVPQPVLSALDARVGRGPLVLDEVSRAMQAGVVVLGGKRRRALTRIGGSTVTHMVRLGHFPVLATDGIARDIRRILVPVDLSYAAAPTIKVARRWAALLNAELRVLHCVEPVPIVPGLRTRIPDDEAFRSSERSVQREITPLFGGHAADIVIRRGRAAGAITAETRQWRADLIVVGSHGRGWVDRLLIGSTSERLLNVLPANVLVVPVHKPANLVPSGRVLMPWESATT